MTSGLPMQLLLGRADHADQEAPRPGPPARAVSGVSKVQARQPMRVAAFPLDGTYAIVHELGNREIVMRP